MTTDARCLLLLFTLILAASGGAPRPSKPFDVIVRGGTVYDGSGGAPILAGGEHTGATPGRVVRGPGWTG